VAASSIFKLIAILSFILVISLFSFMADDEDYATLIIHRFLALSLHVLTTRLSPFPPSPFQDLKFWCKAEKEISNRDRSG